MRIDSEVRKYLLDNRRIAKDFFPWTTLSDTVFNDVLRAIQLTAGDGFDILLSGVTPPGNFNEDVRIFKPDVVEAPATPVLPDPLASLIGHFVGTQPLTELE